MIVCINSFLFQSQSLSSDSCSEEIPQLFKGDVELPMLNINLEEGMEEILFPIKEPPSDYVCRKVPVGCQENSTLLIDTRALKNPNDWKADDLGVFHHVGKVNLGYYEVTETESHFLSKTKPSGKMKLMWCTSRKPTGCIKNTRILNEGALRDKTTGACGFRT